MNDILSKLLIIVGLLVLAGGILLLQAYIIYCKWPTKRVIRRWKEAQYEWVEDVQMWVIRDCIETEE